MSISWRSSSTARRSMRSVPASSLLRTAIVNTSNDLIPSIAGVHIGSSARLDVPALGDAYSVARQRRGSEREPSPKAGRGGESRAIFAPSVRELSMQLQGHKEPLCLFDPGGQSRLLPATLILVLPSGGSGVRCRARPDSRATGYRAGGSQRVRHLACRQPDQQRGEPRGFHQDASCPRASRTCRSRRGACRGFARRGFARRGFA